MGFGNRLRAMRTAKGLSQWALGERVGVLFTYISKVENGKLDFGNYPSQNLICRLAALDTDEEELLPRTPLTGTCPTSVGRGSSLRTFR